MRPSLRMLLRLPKPLPPHLPTEMRLALPLPMAHLAVKTLVPTFKTTSNLFRFRNQVASKLSNRKNSK